MNKLIALLFHLLKTFVIFSYENRNFRIVFSTQQINEIQKMKLLVYSQIPS
jgi:hypothetical protein